MKRLTFTDEQKQDIVRLYKNKESTYNIALAYSCSRQSITRVVLQAGEPMRTSRLFTDEEEQVIKRKYESGATTQALMSEYGCSKGGIREVLKRTKAASRHKTEFSAEQAEELSRRHAEGESLTSLAAEHKCQRKTVQKAIKRAGGKVLRNTDKPYKLVEGSEQEDIATAYANGQSSPAIAKRLNRSTYAVLAHCRKKGVSVRATADYYSENVNHQVFDNPQFDENACFYLGLLMADGSVSKQNVIKLSLSGEDGEVVRQFRDFMESCHKLHLSPAHKRPIHERECHIQEATRLAFTSSRIARKLADYGIVCNKTGSAAFTYSFLDSLDDKSQAALFRGAVCGDGWLGCARTDSPMVWQPSIGLCGSRELCEQFQTFVLKRSKTNSTITRDRSIWRFEFRGTESIHTIKALFGHSGHTMPRKQNIADIILNWYYSGSGALWDVLPPKLKTRLPCEQATHIGCRRPGVTLTEEQQLAQNEWESRHGQYHYTKIPKVISHGRIVWRPSE